MVQAAQWVIQAVQWIIQAAHYPTASVVVLEVMFVEVVWSSVLQLPQLRLVVAVAVAVAVQPSPFSSLWPSWVEEVGEEVAVAVQARPRPRPRLVVPPFANFRVARAQLGTSSGQHSA